MRISEWCSDVCSSDLKLAPCMRPAERTGQRHAGSPRIEQRVVAGIGIGLEDAVVAFEMPDGVLGAAIARIMEQRRRRIEATERPVVAHVGPYPGDKIGRESCRDRVCAYG